MARSEEYIPKHFYYIYDNEANLKSFGLNYGKTYNNDLGTYEYVSSSDPRAKSPLASHIEILDNNTGIENYSFFSPDEDTHRQQIDEYVNKKAAQRKAFQEKIAKEEAARQERLKLYGLDDSGTSATPKKNTSHRQTITEEEYHNIVGTRPEPIEAEVTRINDAPPSETPNVISKKSPKPGNNPKPAGKKGLVAGFGGPLGFGLAAWTAVSSYSDARSEGHGRLSSAAHAATELILPEFLGWKTKLLLDFASFAPKAAIQGMQSVAQVGREYERAARDQSPFRTNTFVDSQQIYTMRQAGVALAEQSKYSLQQTLIGNEAKYMHR